MRKKILIAVDASVHSRRAIDFAAMMAARMTDFAFDLLHIESSISGYLLEDARKNPDAVAELKLLSERNRSASLDFLETCRKQMIREGVPREAIGIRTQERQYGPADDIARFAEAGFYDAILVGRRGVTALRKIFMGSVTANILAQPGNIPVWVVDGAVKSSGILISVDGSPHSMRAVDHVALMLTGSTGISVHILSVEPPMSDFCDLESSEIRTGILGKVIGESYKKCISNFRQKAIRLFEEAGVRDDRYSFSTIEKQVTPARAIIDEAAKSGCGIMVMGKRGTGSDAFMGRNTTAVLQKMTDAALWVVP